MDFVGAWFGEYGNLLATILFIAAILVSARLASHFPEPPPERPWFLDEEDWD